MTGKWNDIKRQYDNAKMMALLDALYTLRSNKLKFQFQGQCHDLRILYKIHNFCKNGNTT